MRKRSGSRLVLGVTQAAGYGVFLALLWLTGILNVGLSQEAQEPSSLSPRDQEEVEFGKQAVAALEKQYKVITEGELNERVQRVGKALAAIAAKTPVAARWGDSRHSPFEYTFKVINDKDVNAFSIPGGFIYVHKGLLDFVQSDHELAGVLAHEIAHAAHHHVMMLLKENDKVNRQVVLPVLLGALLGRLPTNDTLNLAYGTELYRIARINQFGQEAESDSDLTAIEYLRRSPYNPVGLLTFLERLASEEAKRPQIDWGIFRTHPPTRERVQAVYNALKAAGIPIRRREVCPNLRVLARPASGTSEGKQFEVAFEAILIFRPADDPEKGSSKDRSERIAARLNHLLDEGLELFEVRLTSDKRGLLLKGEEVIRITQADSELNNQPAEALASQALEAIKRLLWSETIRRLY